ncbi:MAG: hypothetical protein IJ128_01150 [Firmicutes bacterium]|nr:hypothetical protein [Bacillota bacterium]
MKRSGILLLIISVFCIMFILAGCSTKDSDQDFDGEYDIDSLQTEYADQLVRDGAETVIGTVEITGTEDDYSVTVAEKKIVKNENYENGYYIADRNMSNTYPLGSDQGIVAMEDGVPAVCTTEDFIKNHSGDSESLYTVYLIGDVVELILPLDPQTMVKGE